MDYRDPDTPDVEVALSDVLDDLVELIAERNFDLYEADGTGNIRATP